MNKPHLSSIQNWLGRSSDFKELNMTKAISFFVIFLASTIFLTGCNNNQEDISSLDKKLDTLLKEKGINLNTVVKSESAEQVGDEAKLIEISTSVVNEVSQGKLFEAFDIIKKHSPLPESEFKVVKEQAKKQFEVIKPRFGDFIGYEFINSKKIGNSIIRHDYIVKCENHVIRWEFIYYKPKDKWFLNSFKWDDQIGLINND